MLELKFGSKIISTKLPSFVMGIVNATPDSFYEGSRGGMERAFSLIEQGAHIIDIGGESTRPGFTEVSVEEEIRRIVPIIEAIRKKSDVVISVDTRKYDVMKAAYEAGADVLNDVAAMEYDPKLAGLVAKNEISVILMNNNFSRNQNENPNLYKKEKNQDVENDVQNFSATEDAISYLKKRIEFANLNGISDDKIILDPGIGFGTTFLQDIDLIKNIDRLCDLGFPVLMALSRKRCIGLMTGNCIDGENGMGKENAMKTADKRLAGTLAAGLISVQKGAKILRVHDVEETVDTLKVMSYTY